MAYILGEHIYCNVAARRPKYKHNISVDLEKQEFTLFVERVTISFHTNR